MKHEIPEHAIVIAEPSTNALKSASGTTFSIDLAAVSDKGALLDALGRALHFPYPAAGFDALVGLLAGLEWVDDPSGYQLELRGLDQLHEANEQLLHDFVAVLPDVCDRSRSGERRYIVVLCCRREETRRAVRSALEDTNRMLAADARDGVADVGPIPVIELAGDEEA